MKKDKVNYIVSEAFFRTGVAKYQFANYIGISEQTLYRKLRIELPIEEQKEIVKKIEEFAKEPSE